MRHRFIAIAILLLVTSPLQAQWFDWSTPGIPRTAEGRVDMSAPVPRSSDGHTDFSGKWTPTDASGSLFDLDNYQGWALDVMAENESTFFVDDPRFNCLPDGPASYPAGSSVGGTRRIVQTPTFIAVLNPDMTYRQIHLDGRAPVENPILPNWLGYSAAHWEGDTLVVVTAGFNDKTWLTREGLPHTDQLRITERYTRQDFGHITLEITYEDPGVLNQPVQATVDLVHQSDLDLLENVCNESETAQRHYNGELSQAEEKVVEVPLELLESYVGTYQGVWLGSLITAEVYLENGQLFLTRSPRYSDTGGNTDTATSVLVAQSENAFNSTFGLGWIFNRDENGEISSVSEVHVSGAWPFERVR
ncbi:hypothetical protein N8600_06605 [Gammaproteobacteria bacterium]|nr:hypothetical protein [Gammaproteobacteria bacterium]